MKIISRKDALAAGLTRYFTGKPCIHGHISQRSTSNKTCLECHSARKAEHYLTNRQHYDRYHSAYRKAHRAECRAYGKKWADANKEKIRLKGVASRAANRESLLVRKREYAKQNREKYNIYSSNRRARVRNAEGRHTASDIRRIFEFQRGRCANCLIMLNSRYEIDHIVALSRGGSNWPSNIQLLCMPCNRSKHAMDPIAWKQAQGMLI
ncbi:HNH endonuclease [Pseudomonas aeruginosa]|uniref:HNH endonuclease n=1 Tax=Pseudomonas aeruginosa TaxID=287 RepID=UPI0011B76F9D|nr:HNH endonuclease signature motif containing protein [Pseudomonas aeruginosa]TWW38974.1 HNH endonuclease [Pseudomonas aeruginosa]TWX98650.1 HNH endonuclease [Pseudomonas aeruginosa]